jgi:hypothetical protein
LDSLRAISASGAVGDHREQNNWQTRSNGAEKSRISHSRFDFWYSVHNFV